MSDLKTSVTAAPGKLNSTRSTGLCLPTDFPMHANSKTCASAAPITCPPSMSSAPTIARIMARKAGYKIRSTRLVVMENGQPMTTSMLRKRFDDAREAAGIPKADFQMRDLRAKAATDKEESTGNIRAARDQLGHTTVGMTEQYIRMRKGMKVTPTK
jgi:hypothetical protein